MLVNSKKHIRLYRRCFRVASLLQLGLLFVVTAAAPASVLKRNREGVEEEDSIYAKEGESDKVLSQAGTAQDEDQEGIMASNEGALELDRGRELPVTRKMEQALLKKEVEKCKGWYLFVHAWMNVLFHAK